MSMLLRVKAILALMGVDGGDDAMSEAEVLRLLSEKANANHKHDADYLHLGVGGYTNQLHQLGGPVNLINRAPGAEGANEPILRLGSQIANGMLRSDRWVADVYYDSIHFRRVPGSEVYMMDFNPDSPSAIINRAQLNATLEPLRTEVQEKQNALTAGNGITIAADGTISASGGSMPSGAVTYLDGHSRIVDLVGKEGDVTPPGIRIGRQGQTASELREGGIGYVPADDAPGSLPRYLLLFGEISTAIGAVYDNALRWNATTETWQIAGSNLVTQTALEQVVGDINTALKAL